MKFILIHTDGYSIDCDDSYKTIDEARQEMNRQYNENIPIGGLVPEWEDMSFINMMMLLSILMAKRFTYGGFIMKKFLEHLKEKGYKISGSKAFLLGVEFTICSGYIHTAIGRQKSYWLELKKD